MADEEHPIMQEALDALEVTFGHSSLRLAQEATVRRLLVDEASACKSLCYQLPALCIPDLTLVISPLLSLMKDQVDVLVKRGVAAAQLDSSLSMAESRAVKDGIRDGTLKLLFVAPERLNNESFVMQMRDVKIGLLAVDEAHCISQWGTSFRPDYLKIARFAQENNITRVLALTATATPTVAKDICAAFDIDPDEGLFQTPVYRSNLRLSIATATNLTDKMQTLVPFLKKRKGGPAIVYVTSQQQTSEVAGRLKAVGMDARMYHAGMNNDDRASVQDAFMKSTGDMVVVATIAFGMGIDKSNVVHMYLPKSVEGYSQVRRYEEAKILGRWAMQNCTTQLLGLMLDDGSSHVQEIGRAGRDGKPSDCLMYLCPADVPMLEGFARGDTPSEKGIRDWLTSMCEQRPAEDGTVSSSQYWDSRSYDIRTNALNLIAAKLELDPELQYWRTVTPIYTTYEFTKSDPGGVIDRESTPAAKALRAQFFPNRNGKITLEVEKAAKASKIDRQTLAQTISAWEMRGLLSNMKPSQVKARYLLDQERPLPETEDGIRKLAKKLFDGLRQKEEDEVGRIRQVIALATADKCIARGLSDHFGDAVETVDKCGECSFCKTGQAAKYGRPEPSPITKGQIEAVLEACPIRSDPRLLTKIAFGITSPRTTELKLHFKDAWGTMSTCDFEALLERFDAECKKVGYEDPEGAFDKPTNASGKRPASGTLGKSGGSGFGGRGGGSSSRGGGSRGGGGGFKRGRK